VKKNNAEWLENNTKIHYSVERIFTRYGDYNQSLLSQEGAFVDILRVVCVFLSACDFQSIDLCFYSDVSNEIRPHR